MRLITVAIITALVAGCAVPEDKKVVVDRCMQKQIFFQCMKALPAGPLAAKYNDWDEVVAECERTARNMSLRAAKHVKPNCYHPGP